MYARSMSSVKTPIRSAYTSHTDSITSVGSRWVITNRASGKARSSASSDSTCAGDLSRHGRGGSPHCSSFRTRRSYRYVDVRSASTNHSEYDGICANAWKICDLKSSDMSSRHSIGPCSSTGTCCLVPASSRPVWPIRGSGPSTVEGGGHGCPDSHMRRYRTAGSCASRNESAVEPVRGRLTPNSGGSSSTSSISGWRRYQSSTWSRWARWPTIRGYRNASPVALSRASSSSARTRISSPSRNESSPKSSSPVSVTAVAMRSSYAAIAALDRALPPDPPSDGGSVLPRTRGGQRLGGVVLERRRRRLLSSRVVAMREHTTAPRAPDEPADADHDRSQHRGREQQRREGRVEVEPQPLELHAVVVLDDQGHERQQQQ